MRTPPLPANEAERLRALRDTGLLDSLAEERFDRVTRTAQKLFSVPIALFSLIDEDRQWFKSCQGLQARQTPRSVSFCGHAILEEGVFCVEDAADDVRFADNPLVVDEPRIRFYAGCPVHSPSGRPIGTLCIIDREPRRFSVADRRALTDLAQMLEAEVHRAAASVVPIDSAARNRGGDTG